MMERSLTILFLLTCNFSVTIDLLSLYVPSNSGYMAPEYAMHGQFSVKSDVFSFGVLVLEMVTGQKNQYIRNGESMEHLLSYVSTQ